MKRKILLPTDFSDNATQAINYALELYKDESCIFYLLNVFYIDSSSLESIIQMEPGTELYETTKERSQKELDTLKNTLAFKDNGNAKHSFQTISTFNNPLEAIRLIVEEKDIELIVMGTRGATNTSSKIYGSTAIDVMEKIRNCPVIVVPQLAKVKLPKEIVFPTSYKTHFKKRELNYLIDIARLCDASIKVLHVSTENELSENQISNKKLLEEYFDNINHTFHSLSRTPISTAINCFVESRDSDMVAFINKKHNFFSSFLSQPLVNGIAYTSNVPILAMHDLRN